MQSIKRAPQMRTGVAERPFEWLAETSAARDLIIHSLIEIEKITPYKEGFNLREEITGPIVDRMFRPSEIVTKRLSNGLTISCRYTSKIVRDFVMAHRDPADHVWEPQTTRLLLHLARDARHVVIGGAYFGDQSTLVAQEIAPRGICHCFELSADNADMIALNARQNDLVNVQINKIGLWSRAATLALAGEDSHAAPHVSPHGPFVARTVDDYVDEQRIGSIDLLMLDIEGGEFDALSGAVGQLGLPKQQAPSLIFEVHGSYVDWSLGLRNTNIIQLIESFGYSCFCIRDYNTNYSMAQHPIELIPVDDVYLGGPPHGFNVVAIKKPELLQCEFVRFCRGVSPKLLFHRDPKLHAPLS
jgi:FkbM family methyltransferase